MKLFVIAGEASGDLHASNCMKEMLSLNPDLDIEFTGGPLMEKITGKKSLIQLEKMAFMGFFEVIKNLGTIKHNFKIIKERILQFKPKAILLVDYPGFNLRMAEWLSKKGFSVYYYISPTVWAWKEKRVEIVRKYIKQMYVILPFEKAFYKERGIDVQYFGHPLIDVVKEKKATLPGREAFIKNNHLSSYPIIAVLPGSRKQEVERMLGIMTEVVPYFTNYQFVIAGTKNLDASLYKSIKSESVKVIFDQTYELMHHAEAGIIKSGTSTLESALFDLPQVVCYKAGSISYHIAKKLVDLEYISLVNLILNKPAVKELIQDDFNAENIKTELELILNDMNYRNSIISNYDHLRESLNEGGVSKRIASDLITQMENV